MGWIWRPKRGPENMKIELNRVPVPQFGPILAESVATASPMAVVAPDAPKRLKTHVFNGFPGLGGHTPPPHGMHVGCTLGPTVWGPMWPLCPLRDGAPRSLRLLGKEAITKDGLCRAWLRGLCPPDSIRLVSSSQPDFQTSENCTGGASPQRNLGPHGAPRAP